MRGNQKKKALLGLTRSQKSAFIVGFLFILSLFSVGFKPVKPAPKPISLSFSAPVNSNRFEPTPKELSTNPWDYFHPSWERSAIWSLVPIKLENVDSVLETPSKADKLVDDPENRIEPEFKATSGNRERVRFWVDIYSHYSSKTRVVHDRKNPGIIYGYMDFRPLYRRLGSKVAAEIKANDYEKKILTELKIRLSEAAGATKSKLLTDDERSEIQSLLSRAGALNPTEFNKLLENIRTQSGQSDIFLAALFRSKHLLPHIESVLKQAGLPIALGRIPFVESSFNSRALSKIGAMGIWQFMPATARELVHAEQEELWADPLRQTKSAARLLRSYRSVLPDWGMTVTSYNSGVGRVRRLVEKYKLKTIDDLVSLTKNDGLGFAGKNFYAEFLAANIVEAYKEDFFGPLLTGSDSALVFKGNGAIPKEACDL